MNARLPISLKFNKSMNYNGKCCFWYFWANQCLWSRVGDKTVLETGTCSTFWREREQTSCAIKKNEGVSAAAKRRSYFSHSSKISGDQNSKKKMDTNNNPHQRQLRNLLPWHTSCDSGTFLLFWHHTDTIHLLQIQILSNFKSQKNMEIRLISQK